MAETTEKKSVSRLNSSEADKYSSEYESTALMIFGFLEETEESLERSCCSSDCFNVGDLVDEEEEEDENSCNVEENKAFWEAQGQLLQATLRRSSSMESKIRRAVKDALKEINLEGIGCDCGRRPLAEGCRNCMQREVSDRLRNAGYNCTTCKSKWRSSTDIPSGEHSYLEVVYNSSSKKGATIKVVVELNFRVEFEMARASQEYNKLIHQLPDAFIGKSERLRTLIKILCSAAKKCMKDKKMHVPPWRKYRYMEAKWLGKCEQKSSENFVVKNLDQRPQPKHKASLLTFDFMENMPSLHCNATIKVV